MILRALQRLWLLPWPPPLRRAFEPLIMAGAVQRFVVPHFRCGVVAIIRNEEGEYLLFRHTYRSQHPWGLPTGFLEHGEQPAAAIHREIAEEARLTVSIGPVWRVYTDDRQIINVVFRGQFRGGTFQPNAEVSRAGFFPLSDLPPLMPDQRRLLEHSEREPDNAGSS